MEAALGGQALEEHDQLAWSRQRPEGHDQHHGERGETGAESTEDEERRGVGPLNVLEGQGER